MIFILIQIQLFFQFQVTPTLYMYSKNFIETRQNLEQLDYILTTFGTFLCINKGEINFRPFSH